jgi:hypothetical protein
LTGQNNLEKALHTRSTTANTAYKKVGGSVQFDSLLLSITFGSGGQERRGKCPPSYMPKTLYTSIENRQK